MNISDWLALGNVFLTLSYVVLTLILVIITGRSLALTRQQVNDAKQQSQRDREVNTRQAQEALEASKLQSQEALAASAKQSEEAVAIVREQIKASEKQAQEALFNQQRPVIIPLDETSHLSSAFSEMLLGNKGTGVALNAWGLLALTNNPQKQHFLQTYFLAPGSQLTIYLGRTDIHYPRSEFEGYNIYPLDGADGLPLRARLMVTYNDVFENKYLSVFDLTNELGWRHIALQKVSKRLDELVLLTKPSIVP